MSVETGERRISQAHPQLFTTYGENCPFAEAYRVLRINLFQGNGQPLWSLGITGAAPGHGSSTTSANLGLIMGEVRSRVVLMDCDLLNPSLHHIFGFLPLIDTRKTCRGSIQGLRIATLEFTRTTDTYATR